jgi:regulator of sirC expression with transglutaminase-like and TPR domain
MCGARSAVERFSGLVARPAGEVDLAEAALALAAGAYPDLDVSGWLRALDRLAAGVGGLADLRQRLFSQLGLVGDTEGYYDPDNSFLHRVLQRRRGIPISLSVLTIEIGRRAGIPIQGVGMPGHFIVWVPEEGVYLDPFAGGAVLDEERAEELFRTTTGAGPEIPFGPSVLPRVTTHEILARMLANLRSLYRASGSATDLEWVLRMRLALPDPEPTEAIELGEALAAQGRFREAARELDDRASADPSATHILQAAAKALRARLN